MTEIDRRSLRVSSLATVCLLAACSGNDPDGPSLLDDRVRGPAVLAFYGDTSAVELPAVARVGEATRVRFTSFSGGCVSQDSTVATVTGLTAEVRPYRRDPRRLRPDLICTADLRLDINMVELRFLEVGRAKVRIVGLAQPGDHRYVVERDIVVTH